MHKKSTTKISIILFSILSCLVLFSCADPNNNPTNEQETKELSEEEKFIKTYLSGKFVNSEDPELSLTFTDNTVTFFDNAQTLDEIGADSYFQNLINTGILTYHTLNEDDLLNSYNRSTKTLCFDLAFRKVCGSYDEEHDYTDIPFDEVTIICDESKTNMTDYVIFAGEQKSYYTPTKFIVSHYTGNKTFPKIKHSASLKISSLYHNGTIYSGKIILPYFDIDKFAKHEEYAPTVKVFSGTRTTGKKRYYQNTYNIERLDVTTEELNNTIIEEFEILYINPCTVENLKNSFTEKSFNFTYDTETGKFKIEYFDSEFSDEFITSKAATFTKNTQTTGTETNNENIDLTGSYTISEANGSTFTFASDSTWTYKYNSRTTEGTWSVSDGKLTITYSLGGYSSTAVFTASISGDTYTLTGKSGDYTTIISSAFKITNQEALKNGVVTLVKK